MPQNYTLKLSEYILSLSLSLSSEDDKVVSNLHLPFDYTVCNYVWNLYHFEIQTVVLLHRRTQQ